MVSKPGPKNLRTVIYELNIIKLRLLSTYMINNVATIGCKHIAIDQIFSRPQLALSDHPTEVTVIVLGSTLSKVNHQQMT